MRKKGKRNPYILDPLQDSLSGGLIYIHLNFGESTTASKPAGCAEYELVLYIYRCLGTYIYGAELLAIVLTESLSGLYKYHVSLGYNTCEVFLGKWKITY